MSATDHELYSGVQLLVSTVRRRRTSDPHRSYPLHVLPRPSNRYVLVLLRKLRFPEAGLPSFASDMQDPLPLEVQQEILRYFALPGFIISIHESQKRGLNSSSHLPLPCARKLVPDLPKPPSEVVLSVLLGNSPFWYQHAPPLPAL